MNRNYLLFLTVSLSLFLMSSLAFAAPNVDGSFKYDREWKQFDDNGTYDNVTASFNDSYGEDYDIEQMGLYINDNILYMGIKGDYNLKDGWAVQTWDNRFDGAVSPGDFAFSFDGGRSYNLGIDYAIDNRGNVDFIFKYGDLEWNNPLDFRKDIPFDVASSTYTQTYENAGIYKVNSRKGKFTIEAAVNLNFLSDTLSSLFDNNNGPGGYDQALMQYTMQCGNDLLSVNHKYGHANPGIGSAVPEPATMFLFGMGLLSLSAAGRKEQINIG